MRLAGRIAPHAPMSAAPLAGLIYLAFVLAFGLTAADRCRYAAPFGKTLLRNATVSTLPGTNPDPALVLRAAPVSTSEYAAGGSHARLHYRDPVARDGSIRDRHS